MINAMLDRIKKITIDIIKQLLIIVLYIFLVIGLELLFKNDLLSTNNILSNISNITIELIILTIFILIFHKYLIPDFDDFKNNGKKYIKKVYHYWLIGLVIMIISNIIISISIGISTNQELNETLLSKLPISSIITIIVFAPIIEECMTRVILKDTFKYPIFYYLLSGIIFGSLHLLSASSIQEIVYVIPYGTLGFAFAMMYKKTNNVWTNIFFHSLHNLIAVLIIFRSL